jgi:hypothetical protein
VRDPDDADSGAGPGNGEGGGDGLGGADAFERGVDANASGEVEHRLAGILTAPFDDVGGAELTGDVLALRVAAQGDDALCAKPPGRQHSAQANGAIPDHRHRIAFLHPGADRGVMPGRHHIGQGEQRPERLSGVSRSRDRHQRAAGQRDADGFALAAVDLAVAETAAGNAGDGRPVQAVRAAHVAVDERGDHQITLADFSHIGAGLFDDADELMPDRADRVRRVAPVVPQV